MEIVKYDIETAVITALEAKYAGIVVTDGKSRAAAMGGLAEYRELRLKIDDKHKELKKDALEYGRAVDKEKNRLKDLLAPGEQHIKDARQVYDDKIAAKKAEKDRIEQERINKIQFKIQDIEKAPLATTYMWSGKVADLCDEIVAIQITEDVYQEFIDQAKVVKLVTLSALDDIYNEKVQTEKEDAARKAEIEKIEKLRAEQAEAQAKIDAANEKAEMKAQSERDKIAAERAVFEVEKRAEQEKKDRAEFERKAEIKAEEQAKRAAEQEKQCKEKERIEAEKEVKRQAALLPDKEKLIAFAYTLTHIELPDVRSDEAKKIKREASVSLDELTFDIREKAVAL